MLGGHATSFEYDEVAVAPVGVLDVGVAVVVVSFMRDGNACGEHQRDEHRCASKSLPSTNHGVIVAAPSPGVNRSARQRSQCAYTTAHQLSENESADPCSNGRYSS